MVPEHCTGVFIPPCHVLLLLQLVQLPREPLPPQGSFPAQAGAALLPGSSQALGRLPGASCSFSTPKCCSYLSWYPQRKQWLQGVTRGLKLCQGWVHPAGL